MYSIKPLCWNPTSNNSVKTIPSLSMRISESLRLVYHTQLYTQEKSMMHVRDIHLYCDYVHSSRNLTTCVLSEQ